MATYDLTTALSGVPCPAGPAGFPSVNEGYTYRIKGIVDLSKIPTPLVAGDIVKAINVPPGCVVKGVWMRVVEPCGAAMTMSGGDTADGAGWFAATPMNAVEGAVVSPNGTYLNAGAGKAYVNADSVNLVVAGSVFNNSGMFEVIARFERI